MAEQRGGANLYFNFIWSSGTLTGLQQYRTAKITSNPNLIETTSGSDGFKTFIAGIKEWSFDAEFLFNGTETPMGTADFFGITPGVTGTLNIGPLGSATNSIKLSGPAIVETRDLDLPYDDLVKVAVTWRGIGTLTEGTW